MSRTVASTNLNPAPRTFRPLTKPALTETMRLQAENRHAIEALQQSLDGWQSLGAGRFNEFVCDSLPFLRLINPTDARLVLHSHVRGTEGKGGNRAKAGMLEQDQTVLAEDDIVDDDDDAW